MRFSVLISVYKNDDPDHFKEAINSVWKDQTLKPDQIVIVRDGPVEKEMGIVLEELKKQQIFDVLELEKNVGLSSALNQGLELCKNPCVARMDSDDISVSERFEKQIKFLELNPDISLLGGWYEQYDYEMSSVTNDRKLPENHKEIEKFAQTRTPFNHVTAVFNKDHVLEVGGYPEDISGRVEDWWLSLKLIKAGYKLHNLKEYLVKVRGGQGFLDRRGGIEYIKWEIQNLYQMWRGGLISTQNLFKNLIIRTSVRLVNSSLREYLYQKIRNFKTQ